jgi:TPR repeat protein
MCQRKDWKTHKVTCKEAEKLIKILEKDPCRTVDEIDAQLEKYRRLAELGDPSVQYNVGYMYFYGVGVCVDQVESAKW